MDGASSKRTFVRDQVDARGHHRGGVDQRGNRGRALHRVRQPGVERHLSGLRDRPAEEAGARSGSQPCSSGIASWVKTTRKSSEPTCWMSRKSARAKVASPKAFMMKAFLPAATAPRPPVPEIDEEIGGEADHAPAREEEKQVPRLHEEEHREDEKRLVGVIAALLCVPVHVTDGVGEDQEAHA